MFSTGRITVWSMIMNPIESESSTGHAPVSPSQSVPVVPVQVPPFSPIIIRGIFLLLGVGILIPWNAFVSAKPYFQSRLCRDGVVSVDFELWFGLVWNTSSVLSLGLIIASVALKDVMCRKSTSEATRMLPVPVVDHLSETGAEAQSTRSQDSGDTRHSNRSQKGGHSLWLVMVPLSLYLLLFAITDLLVLVTAIDPQTFLMLTLGGLAICGTCGAIATAGIISTAGLFESHLGIVPFFSGQALGGVAVSIASCIAATLEDPTEFWEHNCVLPNQTTVTTIHGSTIRSVVHNRVLEVDMLDSPQTCSPYIHPDWAVFGYFFMGCLVLAGCLVGYAVINQYRQQEYRDDYETVNDSPVTLITPHEQSPLAGVEMKNQAEERSSDPLVPTRTITCEIGMLPESDASLPLADSPVFHETFNDEPSVELDEYTEQESEWAVFCAIKGPVSCIFLVFSLTLCLFPSWISHLRSVHQCQTQNRLYNDLYIPLSFVIFNVGDLIGRLLSEIVPVTRIRHFSSKLVLVALGRFLLFPPLFLLCMTQDSRDWTIPSDVYSFSVQFFFAITNGLLLSCSFMHAPHLVTHNASMQERASEIMTFAVSFGLLTGSLLSFPFTQLATNI